jgi:hypothetical protein
MKNLSMQQAIDEIKNNPESKMKLPEWPGTKFIHINVKGELAFRNFIGLMPYEISRQDWLVIPGAKKPISVNQAWDDYTPVGTHIKRDDFLKIWNDSAKNQDLTYDALLKKLADFFKTGSGAAKHQLKLEFDNVINNIFATSKPD